jgi:hypothetical protein
MSAIYRRIVALPPQANFRQITNLGGPSSLMAQISITEDAEALSRSLLDQANAFHRRRCAAEKWVMRDDDPWDDARVVWPRYGVGGVLNLSFGVRDSIQDPMPSLSVPVFLPGREDMDYSNPSNLRWSVRSDGLTVDFAEVPSMSAEFAFHSSPPQCLLKTSTFPLQTQRVAGALCLQLHRIKSSRDNK